MKESNTEMLRKITGPNVTQCEDHFGEWMKITSNPKPALLIDDSKEETEMIVRQSEGFNIKWEVCYSGEMALDKLCYKRYQLVVLDLKLHQNLEGVQLFRRIKQACPLCPVLILSGYITNEVITEVTKTGFAMFAQKPSVFSSDFFEQLFLALNIPKRGTENEPPSSTPGGENI